MNPVSGVFSGIPVTDLASARPFYERLVGRPADVVVHEGEIMWRLAEGAWLVVLVDPGRAGHALVTLAVSDLRAALGELAGRGIDAGPAEAVGTAGWKAVVHDGDGNSVALVEVARQA